MELNISAARHPIEHAKTKTDSVQKELSVAGAELHLTNTALEKRLPSAQKQGDVRKALDQNAVVESTVNEAAQDLEHVSELLAEEIEQRHRLEGKLRKRGGQ